MSRGVYDDGASRAGDSVGTIAGILSPVGLIGSVVGGSGAAGGKGCAMSGSICGKVSGAGVGKGSGAGTGIGSGAGIG